MGKRSIIVASIIAIAVLSTTVFAVQSASGTSDKVPKIHNQKFDQKDPLKRLEEEKTRIQKELAGGKIEKEKADERVADIDKKIKEINDFNSLSLEEKKSKLINDFTSSINKNVQDGKLTQDKADTAIANYKAKIEKWDGTGYPFFKGKGFGEGSKMEKRGALDTRFGDALDKAIKDGKITQQQKDDILGYLKN